MAGGLVALLDDVATLVKATAASLDDIGAAAAKASIKATGVVVDDTAVTPRYVQGLQPERELPIVKKIAIGSLRNKILFILPAIMLLSQYLPRLLEPILMLGGCYLSFEGAEKIYEALTGHGKEEENEERNLEGPEAEKQLVRGAVTTDFILSAEIMVISLKEVANEPALNRALILIVVAILITALVYGVVALIVKMDDVGLKLSKSDKSGTAKLGRGLVKGMPKLLSALSTIGIAAMLWVGGHILLVGMHELGFHPIYNLVHHWEEAAAGVSGVGGVLGWIVNTLCSAVIGLVVGFVIVGIMHLVPHKTKHEGAAAH